MRSKVTLFLLGSIFLSACIQADNDGQDGTSNEVRNQAVQVEQNELRNFNHPLQYGLLEEGVVLFDVKNDSYGDRYIEGEVVGTDEHGQPYSFMGISTIEREPLSEEDRLFLEANKGPKPIEIQIEKLDQNLANDVIKNNGAMTVARLYLADHEEHFEIQDAVEKEIAFGNINSRNEKFQYRSLLVERRQAQVTEVFDRFKSKISDLGIDVLYECKNSYCMRLGVYNLEQLNYLASLEEVENIEGVGEIRENIITGDEISKGSQLLQFQNSNYMGDENYQTLGTINIGVLEHGGLRSSHPGFLDYSQPFSPTRINNMRDCNGGCSSVSSFSSTSDHATMVAGIAVGDLTDNQDSGVTSSLTQVQRSGYGREAHLYFWRAVGDSNIDDALDDIIGANIDLLNISIEDGPDTPCDGTHITSKLLNDIFQSGITVFVAAGNRVGGHGNLSDCQVAPPNDAMGAFAVAMHTNSNTNDESDVRGGALHSQSARGGTFSEGAGRSIIDISATGKMATVFHHTSAANYRSFTGSGTSLSSPLVTGAASNLMDFYRNNYSNALETPGKMTSHMLLMGDRQGEGSILTSYFDNLWGAGRMKMRMYNDAGMDGPWEMQSWSTCIDHGETYYLNINGANAFNYQINDIKYVISWFDSDHENTGVVANDIDLVLQSQAPGSSTWSTASFSTSSTDEKERVFASTSVSGYKYRLKISGYSVSEDGSCGTNSIRVHIAGFIEDDARNDGDGPYIVNSPPSGTDIDVEF